jgi:hypothetical protein
MNPLKCHSCQVLANNAASVVAQNEIRYGSSTWNSVFAPFLSWFEVYDKKACSHTAA